MIPKRSIVLVYYREPEYLRSILNALIQEFPQAEETEIIIVDNHSEDGIQGEIEQRFPRVHWIGSKENLYYGGGNNLGVSVARGEWVLLMNTDVSWKAGDLRHFVQVVEQSAGVQLAAPVLQYQDGRIQVSAHSSFPTLLSVLVDYCLPLQQLCMATGTHPMQLSVRRHTDRAVAHVTGVCLYLPRSIFLQVAGFDPAYTMYLEETDFQRRLLSVGIVPHLFSSFRLTHFGSAQKTWAQASRHYLRGLRVYTERWWGVLPRVLLLPTLWLSAVLSYSMLLIVFIPTLFSHRINLRVRHYLRVYGKLVVNLSSHE